MVRGKAIDKPADDRKVVVINFSRALMQSWSRTISQQVVPANAGTHHPWPQIGKKASAPVPKREPAPYGSLRSQGRLIETSHI